MKTLKEVCQITGLSEHTIRYYSDLGLIPQLKRDNLNRRQFTQENIEWLNGVKYLRSLGMSLKEIKRYETLCMIEGDEAIKERYEIILKQLDIAKKELEIAKQRILFLEKKANENKLILEHKANDIKNPAKKGKGA